MTTFWAAVLEAEPFDVEDGFASLPLGAEVEIDAILAVPD